MRYLSRYVQRVGLVSTLLIGGVLGGLTAPLPSEAQTAPTLTIDGVLVGLTQITCDSGYNSCWSINGTNATTDATRSGTAQFGNWYVGDVSGTNGARVLINDVSTAGSVDAMKLTGVTFTPVVVAGTKETTIVISHRYNADGGNPQGDYHWAMGMGGLFDPPSNENVVNNRLRLNATGTFPDVVTLGTLDTGTFRTSTSLNRNGSFIRSLPASVVKAACNTGSSKCAPTITYTFTITVAGLDTLFLNDSVIGGGGTCREEGPPPTGDGTTVPPGTPNPLPPGPVCKGFASQVNRLIQEDMKASIKYAKAAGAVVVETCVGACGTGTIIIVKSLVAGSPDGTFGFIGTGEDIPGAFDLTTPSASSVTFSNVSTGGTGGLRTISETVFPVETYTYIYWYLNSVSCANALGENSTSWSNRYVFGGGELDVIPIGTLVGVTVSNLADNDTLTCTFTNERVNEG